MEKIFKRLALIAYPIAYPAWGFEYLYRRIAKRFWEFRTWSGSLYILLVLMFALYLMLFTSSNFLQLVSLYIVTTLEFIGLVVCAGVLLGNIANYRALLAEITKRTYKEKRR